MLPRLFCEQPVASPRITLSGPEAHHLLHVLRAVPGDEVTLFDGTGPEWTARVSQCGRHEVSLEVLVRHQVDRELQQSLTLAVALPKGERQRFLVEKAVELGVQRLLPLHTQRGVAQPTDSALQRLRRAVVEASKQCGRNRLMEIGTPLAWPAACVALAQQPESRCLMAHPAARCPHARPLAEAIAALPPRCRIAAAVGPEGGFTDEEVSAARTAGWQLVDLGPRVLRVETAALALAAVLATMAP
jgi:16S rRNA (uracil1498-N3)-methyltransferase